MFNCIIPYYMSMSIEKLKIKSSLFKLQTKRIVFQRVEKVFLARCRLLRKFLNFVFLRTLLYGGTACSQKTKNAKNAVSSILAAFLKPHRQHFVLPPPLTFNGRHNSVDYILACFRSFIDSLVFFNFVFLQCHILRHPCDNICTACPDAHE